MLTILCIGWFQKDKHMTGLAKGFEKLGHKVIRVYLEGYPRESLVTIDYHWYENHPNDPDYLLVVEKKKRFRIRDVEELYPNIDCICVQQSDFFLDLSDCKHPVFYYHHDLLRHAFPLGEMTGYYYAFDGGLAEYYWARPEYRNTTYQRLVPYGADPENFPDGKNPNRSIPFGFCGAISEGHNNEFKSVFMKDIYKNRKRFLAYCHLYHQMKVEDRLWGPNMFQFYLDHIENYFLTINIPGNWGKYNQRQVEHLLAGNLLLQWYYPELETMGYRDKVNCLFFRNETDIDNQLEWVHSNPDYAEKVRLNGIQFARENHTWTHRAQIILKDMEMEINK